MLCVVKIRGAGRSLSRGLPGLPVWLSLSAHTQINGLLHHATGTLERPGLDRSQPEGAPATQSGSGSSDTVRGKKLGGGAYRCGVLLCEVFLGNFMSLPS